jgi:hypothetical protein
VQFDNGKVAFCGNKELRIDVHVGVKSITSIEIVAYKDLTGLKRLAANTLTDPENTYWKGMLGEAIAKEELINDLLETASKRSGVPKKKIEVEWRGEKELGKKVPDLVMKNTETGKRIIIMEVKYVGDPENVKDFENRIAEAREEIIRYLNDERWRADHGAIVIISWPPEWILADVLYPTRVGKFNNPYIEWVSRKGG